MTTNPLRRFARYLFLASRVYAGRKKAKDDVYSHLHKMRKSIIRMSLSYSDVDKLKSKIEGLIDLERQYAKFFRPEDMQTAELRKDIIGLEQELLKEREEKQRIVMENDAKIRQLNESLDSIKSRMSGLMLEKARRQQRLTALDRKINEKVDVHSYYHS